MRLTLKDEIAEKPFARLRTEAERIKAAGDSSPRMARDPVNLPIICNWLEAIGDANPVYTDQEAALTAGHGGLVAPPAMAQVWTMLGQAGARHDGDPTGLMVAALDEAGYTSVVATNSDQVYHRYLRHGERLSVTVSLVDLAGPKQTALGEGWFFTTRHTWRSVGAGPGAGSGAGTAAGPGEVVATMDFRILKFRPRSPGAERAAQDGGGGDAGQVMRPVVTADTAFFWAGTAAGELRIQRCGGCGALRHPPGPMCPRCGSPSSGHVVAAGAGEVFSYVVHRHPPVPGKRLPIVIALVQLDEGVRVLGELLGADPDHVEIGMPVRVCYVRVDEELTLPAWRLAAGDAGGLPGELPELVIDVSTTFVVASALATRDFTPVHHDRDWAVAGGGKDIFVNILTDTGLVQRYVTDWAGPSALLRRISLRLGVPCYAGDTLMFSGRVSDHARLPGWDRYELAVTGRCGLGDHVIATATVDVPASAA